MLLFRLYLTSQKCKIIKFYFESTEIILLLMDTEYQYLYLTQDMMGDTQEK